MKLALCLLPLLAGLARAQTPTSEQVKTGADADFSQILKDALKPRLPTYDEVRKAQLKRDLENARSFSKGGGEPAASSSFGFNLSNDPERRSFSSPRFLTESLDFNVARPAKRLTLGAGYADHDEVLRGRTVSHDVQRYGFLKLDLSRSPEPREHGRKLSLPSATYTETESAPKQRVSRDEWSWQVFKKEVQDSSR